MECAADPGEGADRFHNGEAGSRSFFATHTHTRTHTHTLPTHAYAFWYFWHWNLVRVALANKQTLLDRQPVCSKPCRPDRREAFGHHTRLCRRPHRWLVASTLQDGPDRGKGACVCVHVVVGVVGVVEVIRTCASHRCNCRTSAHLRSPPLGLRVGAQGAEHSVIGRSQQAWLHAAAVEPVTPRLRDASGPCQATRHSRCLHSSLHSYLHSTPTRPCFRHCQRKAPLDSTRSDHTRCLHVRRAQRQSRRCGVGFVPRRCLVQCSVLRAVSRLL